MKRLNLFTTLVLAAIALLASSCDKGVFSTFSKNQGKSVSIAIRTASSGGMAETKAGGTAVPNNVFSSADDDFVIEEYVSDIEDVMGVPETKGTEIKQKEGGGTGNNFNEANRQFQVMAYIDTVKTVSGVDVTDHVNEFNYPVKYDGSEWDWVVGTGKKKPCWRTSTKYSIWSYWPNDAELTSDSRSAVSVPNWTSGTYNTVSFTHTVPKALEDQQDLLFAYNEETRDFAHVDGDEKKNYVYDGKEQSWIDNDSNDGDIFANTNKQTRNIDIHFYHALAAVKFVVDSAAKIGVDVHSITLCYIDNDTKTIVTNNGLATTGTCSVSGPSLGAPTSGTPGTGTAGVSWSNLGGKKPLHYEIPSDKSVRSGYTETGAGVLFMIPQTATNLSVIIEFTAGDGNKYARVSNIASVNWQAGKYYTYRLKPKFNMPGELLYFGTTGISVTKLMSTPAQKLWTSDYSNTGIKKIGVIVDDYTWSGNSSGAINLSVCGTSAVESLPASSSFEYDFLPVTSIPTSGTAAEVTSKIYKIGDGTKESGYNTYYTYLSTTDHGARYFVFDVENKNPFNIQVYNASGNNGATFSTNLRCVVVLEIKEDENVPVDFTGFDWSTII